MTDKPELRSAILARKVRHYRKAHGWSQEQLGHKLGECWLELGQSRIAAIEYSGSVTIDQAQALADALSVPIEMLIYDEPPSTAPVQREQAAKVKTAMKMLQQQVDRLESADQVRTSDRSNVSDLR
jgi:transcriptional regulator with XRE-family HTH domain